MKTLNPEFLRGSPIPVMPEPRMAKCEPSLVDGAMVAAWRQKGLPLMHVLLFHIPHLLSAAVYSDTLASIEAICTGCQDASGRFLTVLHQWTGPQIIGAMADGFSTVLRVVFSANVIMESEVYPYLRKRKYVPWPPSRCCQMMEPGEVVLGTFEHCGPRLEY
jgi:hypothetical protein